MLKTLAWIVGVVLLLLLLIVVAVQIPAVQNKLLAWAEPTIEEMLGGADVEIDHVDLDFFDAARVEGVLVRDLQGDTVLYARSLGLDIGAFSLFGGSIVIDEATLDGAVVNAYQYRADTAFNYQFLLDAFATTDTVTADTAAGAAFGFDVHVVDITNTRIRLLDEVAGSDFNLRVDRLFAEVADLNLDTLAVTLDEVLVDGLRGSFDLAQVDPVAGALAETVTDTLASGAVLVEFPTAGLPVVINRLSLKRVNFDYADANTERVAEGLDAGNVEIRDLDAAARDFVWTDERLALVWESLSLRERSGLQVDQLAFALDMTPSALALSDFAFRTDASQVLAQAALDYDSFAQFAALEPTTAVDLVLDDSYVAFSDLRLLAPTLADAGVNLDATAKLYADGQVTGTLSALRFAPLELRVGQGTALALSGTLTDALDPERLRYDLEVSRLTSSYNDLARLTRGLGLPPELAGFGRFRFSGSVSGTATAFAGRNLDLRTDGRTGFRGDLALRNLDDPDNLYVTADVRELHTRSSEIAAFVPDSLGVDVAALGDIDFAGTFEGTLTEFDVDATLDTDLGSATADLVADLNRDYTDGSYAGRVALDGFDVGALLRDTTLGELTLDVSVEGSGLTPEAIASNLSGTIGAFTYLGYTYRDITVDGNFDKQVFRGRLAIDDPNVAFAFDGYANLRDSIPDLVFDLRIDTIALEPLNLYPTPLGMRFAVDADIRGNNADNLDGALRIDSLYLNDSARYAYVDSLLLRAGDTAAGRFLALTSDVLNAGIVGDYSVNDLPILLTNYVNDFFPVDAYLSPVDVGGPEFAIEPESQPTRLLVDQAFDYYLELSDPVDLVRLFDPGLERLDTASFVGRFDSREKSLTGVLRVPDLEYAGTVADTIVVEIGGDATEMIVDLRSRGLQVAGQDLDLVASTVRLGDDRLRMSLEAFAERDSLFLGTGVTVGMNDAGRYLVTVDEEFEIAGQTWRVDPANRIEYWDNYLDVDALAFEKDGQRIAVQSDDESQDADIAPISLTIENYQLAEVARLVELEGFSLSGTVDGKAAMREPGGAVYYTADLDVRDIVLNEQPVGTLVVNATSEDLAGVVGIDVRLDGPVNDLAIAGEYGIADGALDLAARVRAFELRVVDPLAQGILSDSEGLLRADLDIGGTVDAPAIDGYVALDGAATTYDLLGARFAVADSRIELTERVIDFGTFVVADSLGRTATVSGAIEHDYFAEFDFDLRVQTDGFRVLNTAPTLEELYFGEAVVAADIAITGDLVTPVVRGNVATQPGTDVSIVPLLSVNGVSEESWIIYADPATIEQDTAQSLGDVYDANALGIDLALVIDVDDDAVLHVIVDPATGDALKARGTADLNVQMSPDGDITVTGLYEITEGAYEFTFKGAGLALKQYDFEIRPGSTMRFVGDPLDSRFDIAAIYAVETETQPLLEAYASSGVAGNAGNATRRQRVEVVMNLDGTLEEPSIVLDIEVPEAGGTVNTNEVQAILASLNTQQVYQEVFSLLVTGGFAAFGGAGGGGGFDAGSQAEVLAFNSLSKLVSNQLNSLADRVVPGFELSVGLEQYDSEYTGRQTTANVDLSRSLFDDRLTITFGTDINVGQETSAAVATNAGGLQTNFVLAYQLTESGRYQLRVFRRPDFDIVSTNTPYENGAGVSYRRRWD